MTVHNLSTEPQFKRFEQLLHETRGNVWNSLSLWFPERIYCTIIDHNWKISKVNQQIGKYLTDWASWIAHCHQTYSICLNLNAISPAWLAQPGWNVIQSAQTLPRPCIIKDQAFVLTTRLLFHYCFSSLSFSYSLKDLAILQQASKEAGGSFVSRFSHLRCRGCFVWEGGTGTAWKGDGSDRLLQKERAFAKRWAGFKKREQDYCAQTKELISYNIIELYTNRIPERWWSSELLRAQDNLSKRWQEKTSSRFWTSGWCHLSANMTSLLFYTNIQRDTKQAEWYQVDTDK